MKDFRNYTCGFVILGRFGIFFVLFRLVIAALLIFVVVVVVLFFDVVLVLDAQSLPLVDVVQHAAQQLLGVVLAVPAEVGVYSGHDAQQVPRHDAELLPRPSLRWSWWRGRA